MALVPTGLGGLGLVVLAFFATVKDGGPSSDAPGPPPEIDDPDRALVEAVRGGDGTAYRGLVERYQGRIYAVIYGMVRNREDARELTQEAFVKAYRNLGSFRLEAKFSTWLRRIAMNVSIDHLRRQKLRRTEEFDEGIASRDQGVISLAHHREDPGRNLEQKRLRERIFEAMDSLPDDQQQAIVLREIEGLAYKEIAEIMGIPEGTVMSRLYYARKKLQALLADERG